MTGTAPKPALILLPSLTMGGSERKFVRTSTALARRGLPIHLGYFNEPETLLPEVDDGVRVLPLRRRGKYSLACLRRLRDYVRDNDIAAVVGVNFYPLFYTVPIASLSGGRGVTWMSSINTTRFIKERDGRFMPLIAPLLRRMDRVVFGNRGQLRHWVETYRLSPARAEIVYNGVDLEFFSPQRVSAPRSRLREELGYGDADLVVLCVGLLRSEKGQIDLVEALAKLREPVRGRRLQLLLVGDGPLRPAIEARAQALGIADRVRMTGVVKDVRPLLKTADVFALPSHSETFSNAALEAGAMGLPLVLSEADGNLDLVARDDCGLLFPVGDVAALAAHLRDLMVDDEHRQNYAERARAAVAGHFSLDVMADGWARLLWPDAATDRSSAVRVDAGRDERRPSTAAEH